MRTKFSEDVVLHTDLKANPGWVVKHVAQVHRPVLLTRIQSAIPPEELIPSLRP